MDRFSRRKFLELGAAAAGVSLAGRSTLLNAQLLTSQSQTVAPSDRVRFGIIGVGMQGSQLLLQSLELPGIECAAACDLYDGRHTVARENANLPDLPITRHYQEFLADKNIDCIIAAVPDHWHKKIVIDTVHGGKRYLLRKTHVA